MSKKEQAIKTPLEEFTGEFLISLVNGKALKVEITGAFSDSIAFRDTAGHEGIIPWHAIVLMAEDYETIPGGNENETTKGA